MSEKSEQATPKKLREARSRGQFAKSRILAAGAATAGGMAGFLAFADQSALRLQSWTAQLLSGQTASPATAIHTGLMVLVLAAAPALGGAFLGALAVSVGTAGLQVNAGTLAPSLERLDPIAGLKRLFSLKQVADLGKGLVVAAVITVVFWVAVDEAAAPLLRLPGIAARPAFSALLSVLRPALERALAVLLVLGAIDYLLMRRRHVRELMMTKHEVKQEYKQSEGDPHHKAKRKALHRQLASAGQARGLQKATAVVVNPTHIAVALRYDETECDAPYIVAKGREEDALNLKREAKKLGIPVVRNIPLARSLVHFDVGEEVPEELYQAAAALLKVALEHADHPDRETP